jgi:uncharacterized protein (TIRG00374 family)
MKKKLLFQWSLGIAFLVVVFYLGDVSSLARLPRVNWHLVFFAFLATLCFFVIHNLRWMDIVRGLRLTDEKAGLPFMDFLRWLVNSYVMGMVVPADLSLVGVRMFYLHRSNTVPPQAALFSLLLDRCLDLVVFVLFLVPAMFFFLKMGGLAGASVLFLALLCLVLFFIAFRKEKAFDLLVGAYAWALKIFARLPVLKNKLKKDVTASIGDCRFSEGLIYRILGWSLLKYFAAALRFYLLGLIFGADFSLLQAVLVMPLIQASFLINITPAGLGIVELGTYGALALMGVEESKILLFVVGQRVLFSSFMIGSALIVNLLVMARSRMAVRRAV